MGDLRAGERGQAAVYAVLLFPVLMLVLAFVLAVASAESIRSRLGAQVDMAALTAAQAIDLAALARGDPPSLVAPQAEGLAREYLARNLAATGDLIAGAPADVASRAEIVVTGLGTDPFTGTPITAPTVSIRVSVPARIPMLGAAGLGPVVTFTITGSAAARS
jgi:Putative Flp pilus-assembly TadE/G-like